jgi:hypothetical protein
MREEKDDEILDEMPDGGGAPCGQIFGSGDSGLAADADDDDMPAPEGRCGDQFAGSQVAHLTDADDV